MRACSHPRRLLLHGRGRAIPSLPCCALLAALACSSDPGAAFPDRRPDLRAPGHLLGYVANRSSDTISVLDLDAMATLGTAPVGRDPVAVDGPRHVLLDASAGLAYVVLSYPADVVGPHEAAAGTIPRPGWVQALALDDLRPLGELRLEPRAEEMSLSDGGGQLAVVHDDTLRAIQSGDIEQRRASLTFVDGPAALATAAPPQARRNTVCVAPSAVAYGAGGARAFVACTGEDALAVVDPASARVLARVAAGTATANKPTAVVADARGERVLVSNQVSRTAALFTAGDAPVLAASFAFTGVPAFAAWISDDQIVVPLQDPSGAALLDAAAGTVLREVFYADGECESPSEARPAGDGRLFLVCQGDHYAPGAVAQLDPRTLQVIARVAVGVYPDRLALRAPQADR